jgi:cobalt/nickel transport system permease protein
MSDALPVFLRTNESRSHPYLKGRKRRLPFLDRTLQKLAELIKIGYSQADTASRKGLLQKLDARTKLIFLISFIVIISFQRQIPNLLLCFFFILILYPLSGLNLILSLKKAFWPVFFFGFIVISPAMLNIVSGGEIKFKLIQFDREYTFWIYHLPASIGISGEGIQLVIKLFLKISNSILLTLLIFSTTSFAEIIKAMRLFRVPDIILLSITLSYKFIFILAKTTEETYLSLRSRWINHTNDTEGSKIIAGRISFVFRKSWNKYEEIYRAMIARGFSGRVNLCYSGKFHLRDLIFCFVLLGFYSIFIYLEYSK